MTYIRFAHFCNLQTWSSLFVFLPFFTIMTPKMCNCRVIGTFRYAYISATPISTLLECKHSNKATLSYCFGYYYRYNLCLLTCTYYHYIVWYRMHLILSYCWENASQFIIKINTDAMVGFPADIFIVFHLSTIYLHSLLKYTNNMHLMRKITNIKFKWL